ncbi:putative chromosome transmission fidelity factor [Fasciola gigantica]|uniref:Putative chromosome transmission fidelity factor n=1 Tax=Fasciola gigantica TaxID=46835 RepID=A0A504YB02_FASGI|nr:putative chromosome transmission fidelity factor [Fasciola gigantica]
MTMGIFENYLNCRMKDSSLNVARQASTWFTYHDLIFRRIHSNTDFSLLRYTSHLPAWFHLTLATPLGLTNASGITRGTSYLHWPTAHTEANAKRQQCSSILDHLLANQWTAPGLYDTEVLGSNASSFRFLPRRRFLLDVASSTLRLLSLTASSLRPLNAQLYSQQETVHLANLVSLMLNLGLDLSPQQNAETGEVELHLDPRLDQVVCFSSNTSTAMRNIAHTTKQLIARELAVERMRRAARNLNAASNSVNRHPTQPMQPKLSPKLNPSSVVSVPLNSSTDKKSKIRCDFFGRPLTDTRTTGVVSNKTKEIDNGSENPKLINRALYYRFREGYSNAVRRPVTMKHFL